MTGNVQGLTGIVPFTYFGGAYKPVGSTFLRAEGLAAVSPHFEIWQHGKAYSSLIFQKVYWIEMMELFQGPKILDLCDADWVSGSVDIVEVGNKVDAITCSSEALTGLMRTYFPQKIVEYIPDRLNFEIFPDPRPVHSGAAKNAVWFGFAQNAYETLGQLYDSLSKHNLKLTILADRPYAIKDEISLLDPEFIKYENQSAYHHIRESDIVLNPRSGKGNFKYKSNNKSVISWKLGVPVAETAEDVERLIHANARNEQVSARRQVVEHGYNVAKSADQYSDIVSRILSARANQ